VVLRSPPGVGSDCASVGVQSRHEGKQFGGAPGRVTRAGIASLIGAESRTTCVRPSRRRRLRSMRRACFVRRTRGLPCFSSCRADRLRGLLFPPRARVDAAARVVAACDTSRLPLIRTAFVARARRHDSRVCLLYGPVPPAFDPVQDECARRRATCAPARGSRHGNACPSCSISSGHQRVPRCGISTPSHLVDPPVSEAGSDAISFGSEFRSHSLAPCASLALPIPRRTVCRARRPQPVSFARETRDERVVPFETGSRSRSGEVGSPRCAGTERSLTSRPRALADATRTNRARSSSLRPRR